MEEILKFIESEKNEVFLFFQKEIVRGVCFAITAFFTIVFLVLSFLLRKRDWFQKWIRKHRMFFTSFLYIGCIWEAIAAIIIIIYLEFVFQEWVSSYTSHFATITPLVLFYLFWCGTYLYFLKKGDIEHGGVFKRATILFSLVILLSFSLLFYTYFF